MSSQELKVQSEIYSEIESALQEQPVLIKSNVASSFRFKLSKGKVNGDLIPDEDVLEGVIKLEHSASTPIRLVGLQIWRGALLLADFILHYGETLFKGKTVLELGAGVGLTSVVAAMFAKEVVATDLDIGGILELLKSNFKLNSRHVQCSLTVIPLDFFNLDWTKELTLKMEQTDIVLAADVIYDNDLTQGLMNTLAKILKTPPKKTVYICLEKRYVFSSAPCHDHFLELVKQCPSWHFEQVPLDFPQYFYYERVKHLVLWKLSVG